MIFPAILKSLALVAVFATGVFAAPSSSQIFDLVAHETALDNPDNRATVWVLDCKVGEVCDITKGHLEVIQEETDLEERGISEICSAAHQAVSNVCASIIRGLQSTNLTINSGQTRSFCLSGGSGQCCVSWSANASFSSIDLGNDAAGCFSVCAAANVSCQARGVTLGGRAFDVCVSNRATGCT